MKKLILIFLTLAFSLSLFACGDKGGDGKTVKLKINEVTHSIFYAPFYVAVEAGFFAEENIETEIVNGGGSDASMTAILSGAADIALLGPETGIYTLLGSPKDPPVIFAQLTKRDGSFLIGREKAEDFKWTDLIGKEIIAGRKGGSPAMSLEYALNKNGLYNGRNVTLNFDVQFNMTTAAFEGGTGDFVTAFEPTASELVRAGKGHIIASVGAESGEVPFTCFMAKRSFYDKNEDVIERFVRAIMKAVKFIAENDEQTVAKKLLGAFPAATELSVTDSLKSYKEIDAWKTDLIMTEQSFLRLEEVMRNAGELDDGVDYARLVDNYIAEKVFKEVFG